MKLKRIGFFIPLATLESMKNCEEEMSENKLYSLMKELGEKGHFVYVKYDPFRERANWTVVVDTNRLGDTNNPVELLERNMDVIETYYKIEFLLPTTGNSPGETAVIVSEDDERIYYSNGNDDWVFLFKNEEGTTYKRATP